MLSTYEASDSNEVLSISEVLDPVVGKTLIYRVTTPEKGILFLLSGAQGVTANLNAQARRWAQKSYLVVVIDWPHLQQQQPKAGCLNLAELLLNSASKLKLQYQFPADTAPLVMGEDEGAQAVYIALSQADPGAFHAGISLDFCPVLAGASQFCKVGRYQWGKADNHNAVLPNKLLGANWYVFQRNVQCDLDAQTFVDTIPSAKFEFVNEDKNKPELVDVDALLNWLDPRLTEQAKSSSAAGDLPLVEVPASGAVDSDYLVILLTGDGGWAELDKTLAEEFAKQGLPTVALDSLSYFWKKRSPEETSLALSHILNNYRAVWHKNKIIVIGYSFGADVLPFLLSRLPEEDRQWIAAAVFLGLSERANFEFRLSNWLANEQPPSEYDTLMELARLPWLKSLCIEGADDETAVCKQAVANGVQLLAMPGDHHFDEAYAEVAQHIMDFAKSTKPAATLTPQAR